MNNIGDIVTFEVFGDLPAGQAFTFVWNWWDGEVTATSTQSTTKRINMGGNPADAYLLRYTVMMVDAEGTSEVFQGSISVNNPPTIVPPPTATPNDTTFPFSTILRIQAFDFELPTQTYAWFQGDVYLGEGTIANAGSVPGRYSGTLVNAYASTSNELTYIGAANADVRVLAMDADSGTTAFDFQVRGRSAINPFASSNIVTPGVIFEVITQPTRIGPLQTAEFVIYTPIMDVEPTFLWEYEAGDGWVVATTSAGATTPQRDGSYLNSDIKALDTEIAGVRRVKVTITDNPSGATTIVALTTELFGNTAPTDLTITTSATVDSEVAVGDKLEYSAVATDVDEDLLMYKWTFSVPATGVLWGRTVVVDTTGLSVAQALAGTLTVVDRLNAETTIALPTIFVIA